MLKADFHMHTEYSKDCDMSLETIIDYCTGANLDCVAISDHGTADGALELRKIAPFKVIVAEEILTDCGEIMGMFLKESIPSHITVDEAIERIQEQDGLVNIPHPFDPMRGFRMNEEEMDRLARRLDTVEVFNARCPIPGPANKALAFAAKHRLPGTAGTDSHTPGEIGGSWIELPDFTTPEEFLESLRQGRIHGKRTNPLIHVRTTLTKINKRLGGGKKKKDV